MAQPWHFHQLAPNGPQVDVLGLTGLVAAFVKGVSPIPVNEHCHRVGLGDSVGGAGLVRLADRTHAGRAGRQALNARAFSPLTHRWCEAPVSHLVARDSQLAGPRQRRPTLNGWSSWLGRAAARLRLAASPTSWESRAPAGLGRAGLCPHQSPGVGALKNVGVFLPGGSPGPWLDRLGPVRPAGAASWTDLHRSRCAARVRRARPKLLVATALFRMYAKLSIY